jgi:hypothetical protein
VPPTVKPVLCCQGNERFGVLDGGPHITEHLVE